MAPQIRKWKFWSQVTLEVDSSINSNASRVSAPGAKLTIKLIRSVSLLGHYCVPYNRRSYYLYTLIYVNVSYVYTVCPGTDLLYFIIFFSPLKNNPENFSLAIASLVRNLLNLKLLPQMKTHHGSRNNIPLNRIRVRLLRECVAPRGKGEDEGT